MQENYNKKAKILYLVNQFHMHGGIQRMLSHKIDAWNKHCDSDVVVVTVFQENKSIVYPPKSNFKLIDLNLPGVNRHKIGDLIKFNNRLKKIFKDESPDLVITTLTGIPSLILPFIAPQIKKILEIHSSGALSVGSSWKYKWRFLNRYHKVVLLNEDEKQFYKLNNLIVIPNFVQLGDEKKNDYKSRNKRIIAAGRIHPDKQYDHLIRVWELVYKKYKNWELDIFGNGDANLLKEYNNLISQKKLERISFKPATNNLLDMLNQSSIFTLCSDTECFPMVLIECKLAGLPALSYDSPNGPRHIISDDGILVEHNNIESFAEELSLLIEDEPKRKQLSENAWANKDKFSDKVIIKKWQALMQ